MLNLIRTRFHPLWRLRKHPAFRQFQDQHDITVYTRLPDTRVKVAIKLLRDASWLMNSRHLEPEVKEAFLTVFKNMQPKVFWDVGGNIGFYLWFTKTHCGDAEIVIFEADKTNCELINATIKRNKLRNIKTINVAVADSNGIIDFLVDGASGATGAISSVASRDNSSSLHHAYGLNRVISVNSITLDSLLEQGSAAPDLIKIDVEGAEHLVLRGGEKLLRSHSPVLIMETQQDDLIKWLTGLNYQVTQIDAGNVLCIPDNKAKLFL